MPKLRQIRHLYVKLVIDKDLQELPFISTTIHGHPPFSFSTALDGALARAEEHFG